MKCTKPSLLRVGCRRRRHRHCRRQPRVRRHHRWSRRQPGRRPYSVNPPPRYRQCFPCLLATRPDPLLPARRRALLPHPENSMQRHCHPSSRSCRWRRRRRHRGGSRGHRSWPTVPKPRTQTHASALNAPYARHPSAWHAAAPPLLQLSSTMTFSRSGPLRQRSSRRLAQP